MLLLASAIAGVGPEPVGVGQDLGEARRVSSMAITGCQRWRHYKP